MQYLSCRFPSVLWSVQRKQLVHTMETVIPFYDHFVQRYMFKSYLIIINVTHISMFRNYSFNFERNVAKRGRNMERRRERNIAEPKFELKSFRPSSCVFYGRGHI